MAGIHYKEGDNEKARRYLNEAIRNGIKTSEMYNFLGVIYSGEGDYTKAEESFREGIKIEDNSTGRFYLGTVYDKTGQKDSMVEELKRAIEINPDNAGALNYLGYTYLLENRDIEEAYEMIKKACSIEPDNGAFLDSLGWVYYKKGMYDRARELLEKAAGLEKDAEIFEHLGYVYLELKDYTKALYWFVRSYEMSSDSALLKMIEEAKERIKNELN
jgi:tetratricopeptide (TPR) repeat protein